VGECFFWYRLPQVVPGKRLVCVCMYLKETGVEMEVVTVEVARFVQLIVQYSAVLRLAD